MGRRLYRLRVAGRLSRRFAEGLEGVQIEPEDETTLLSAVCVDSAALFGLLDRIRDLGLELLDLRSFEVAGVED